MESAPKQKSVETVFVVGLPRSGTTLLNRTLSSSANIRVLPELWLQLPILNAFSGKDIAATYAQTHVVKACDALEQVSRIDKSHITKALINGISTIYQDIGIESRKNDDRITHIIDKTPRYCPFTQQMLDYYPGNKFIVITRDPVDIICSIIKTWCGGRWKLDPYLIDLVDGLKGVSLMSQLAETDNRLLVVRYEDLIANPEKTTNLLNKFLNLEFEINTELRSNSGVFGKELTGWEGDSGELSKETKFIASEKSRDYIQGWYREYWVSRYLRTMQPELSQLGYNHTVPRIKINLLKNIKRTALDFFDLAIQTIRAVSVPKRHRRIGLLSRRPLT